MKTNKGFLIYSLILFVCGIVKIAAQNRVEQKVDSLKRVIINTPNDTLKIAQYKNLGDLFLSLNKAPELLNIANKGLALSETLDFHKGTIQMVLFKAIALDISGKTEDAILLFNKSLNMAKIYKEKELEAKCYLNIGVSYYFSGDYDKALENQLQAYNLSEELSKKDLSKLLNNIAVIYRIKEKHQRAEEIYLKSYKIKEELKDSLGMAATLMNIGLVYQNINNKEDFSVEYLEKSKKLYQNLGRLDQVATVNTALGDVFLTKKNILQSKKAFKEAWAYFKNNVAQKYSSATLRGLGEIAIIEGNYNNAETYLKQALDFSTKYGNTEDIQAIFYSLSHIKDTLGKKDEAYKMLKKAYVLKDTLNQTIRIKAIQEMQAKFDVKEKSNDLKISNLKLQEQIRQRNIFLAGAIGLALFALTIFFFLKNKIRTNKKIAVQGKAIQEQKIKELQQNNKLFALNSMIEGQETERLRIAKDLHDSLGGLLSTVKNHFSTIQNEIQAIEKLNLTSKTNDLIDEACIEVRRISHNMMPHALSISGLKGAVEDLGEQLNEQGYKTTVEISSNLKTIDETKKIMIYRLVQELISNIRKHANAKTILIQLLSNKNEINLIIEDDGVGFNYEKAITKNGVGLKSINSRVQFLDGNINWDSEINKGTTVIINIPI